MKNEEQIKTIFKRKLQAVFAEKTRNSLVSNSVDLSKLRHAVNKSMNSELAGKRNSQPETMRETVDLRQS